MTIQTLPHFHWLLPMSTASTANQICVVLILRATTPRAGAYSRHHPSARSLFIFLPGVNDDGQKVVMVRTGALANLDSSIDKNDIIRTFTGIIDHLLSQEELQVNGLIQLLDFSHTTMKMHGRLPIEDRKNFIQSFQVGLLQ